MSAERRIALSIVTALIATSGSPTLLADEDIEYVQEHLPEVAMDNRYATLPLWEGTTTSEHRFAAEFQSAYSNIAAGGLQLSGPMMSIGTHWRLNDHWQVGAFGFYDPLDFTGSREERDLQTLFAPSTPLTRPVAAVFTGLNGAAMDLGVGINVVWQVKHGWLGRHEWLAGVLWQSMKLEDYRFDYVIQEGPQAGTSGMIDFDAQYTHVAPFLGFALPRDYVHWTTNAHVLAVVPLPRRGIVGHITGPNFDITGDTEEVGNGKHFGDPSLTFGYTVTYRPAHLSIDLGALATQGLLERRAHKGIEQNVLLSASMAF